MLTALLNLVWHTQNLDENVDENLAWLTQKTEDSKSNEGNLTPPPHTANVIELNCKVLKK